MINQLNSNPTSAIHCQENEVSLTQHPEAAQYQGIAEQSSHRSSLRRMRYQLASLTPPQSAPERVYVGELQERWKFPSDHLPIGISIEDEQSSCRIVSWNVLNSAYLHWIYENTQGLAQSDITKENLPITEKGLTQREQHVIESLLGLVDSDSHVLCLQECSELFIQELELQLPSHIKIIRSSDLPVENQNIVLYDTHLFKLVEKSVHTNAIPSESSRPLMEVVLEKNGIPYRIFNAHLRCNIKMPYRHELAQFMYTRKKEGEVTMVMGDLNVDQALMEEALTSAASESGQSNSFRPFSPYKTTVSPELYSKTIDHIFVDTGANPLTVRKNSANELLEGLQELVDLINKEGNRRLTRASNK